MNVTCLSLFAARIVILGFTTVQVPAAPNDRVVSYSSVTLEGTLSDKANTPFKLSVTCGPTVESVRGKASRREYLGVEEQPHCVLSRLSLELGRHAILLPAEVTEDLANIIIPAGVSVTTRGDAVIVHVRGGDGENAYEARLFVEQSRVTAREVEDMDERGEVRVRRRTVPG